MASTFSDVATFDWETLASGVAGDFAYTAAVERYTNSRDGGPPEQTELRATHVYRREEALAGGADMPTADLRAHNLTGDPSRRRASQPAPDLGLVALVLGTESALEILLLRHNDWRRVASIGAGR